MDVLIERSGALRGQLAVPGDKSISHRAVMYAAMATGTTVIEHCLLAADCRSTIDAVERWGARVQVDAAASIVTIEGGLYGGIGHVDSPIDVGNSGTTMRLLAGLAAGYATETVLTGDASLVRRPMRRIVDPLRHMGAIITGQSSAEQPEEIFPPLTIHGGALQPTQYTLPVASAQVKSSILHAGLFVDGVTSVTEPQTTRDHTERLLRLCGVDVARQGQTVTLTSMRQPLHSPGTLRVPGDVSSAAFWLVAGSIVPKSSVTIEDVGLNATRTGVLDVLRYMGAKTEIDRQDAQLWEPRGQLHVSATELRSTVIKAALVPRTIDELPILMVAATQAHGVTEFHGLAELRVKETDRITSMVEGLKRMGAKIGVHQSQELPAGAINKGDPLGDVVVIEGPSALQGAVVKSYGDHRTAMSLAVAALVATGMTTIKEVEAVDISYPGFFTDLQQLGASIRLEQSLTS